MRKHLIIFTICLSFIISFSTQAQSTSTKTLDETINNQSLSQSIEGVKNTSYGAKVGEYLTNMSDWLFARKEAVKQGIAQEKQEFKEILQKGISQIISDAWNKIKNFILGIFSKK